MPRLLDLFCGAGGAAMGYHRLAFLADGRAANTTATPTRVLEGALQATSPTSSTGTTTIASASDTDSGGDPHGGSLRQDLPPVPAGRSPRCAIDDKPATQWSGAFGDPWVGWCSNDCKNAWLNGDKTSVVQGGDEA